MNDNIATYFVSNFFYLYVFFKVIFFPFISMEETKEKFYILNFYYQ